MIKILKDNRAFFIVFLLFVTGISALLLAYSKYDAQYLANGYYNTFFDYFFFYTSQIVEAIIGPIILLIVILTTNLKNGALMLIAYFTAGLVTQVLKKTIYDDVMRPNFLLEDLRLIPDYFELHNRTANSFPSGHTTAAFSMFLMLALISKNKSLGVLYAIIAVLIGYSRVYLSQHFFEDILVGSIIGVTVTLILYYFLNPLSFGKLSQYSLTGKIK